MSQVYIDKVIWTMPVDHNDETEMRANVAMLANRIDDANTSANNRDTAAGMPQSLSFYTMFYKMMMMMKDRQEARKKNPGRCICIKCESINTCMMASSLLSKSTQNTNRRMKNEENNIHSR